MTGHPSAGASAGLAPASAGGAVGRRGQSGEDQHGDECEQAGADEQRPGEHDEGQGHGGGAQQHARDGVGPVRRPVDLPVLLRAVPVPDDERHPVREQRCPEDERERAHRRVPPDQRDRPGEHEQRACGPGRPPAAPGERGEPRDDDAGRRDGAHEPGPAARHREERDAEPGLGEPQRPRGQAPGDGHGRTVRHAASGVNRVEPLRSPHGPGRRSVQLMTDGSGTPAGADRIEGRPP